MILHLRVQFVFIFVAMFFSLWAVSFQAAMALDSEKAVPTTADQVALSYSAVVKRVAPAVVNIYTKKMVSQRLLPAIFDDPMFQQFFGNLQGMNRQRMQSSLGSGVLVSPDGLIVTSNHVIEGADQITVVLADHREYEAELMTSEDRTDLAILRIKVADEKLPFLELKDSDEVEVGDLVLAIGDPFGVGQTVTSGIVSALARTTLDINGINYFIQTDAAINPGNSGGALVTMDGKLIGINAAIYSRSGGYMGIGFAVPSNMVKTVLSAVQQGKKNIVRAWVGVTGQEVTRDVAASLNLPRPTGMLVNKISPQSPAKDAGLKVGDVILKVGGRMVEDPGVFKYRVATQPIGVELEILVLREGKELAMPVRLIAPPEEPKRQLVEISGKNPLAGAKLVNLSPAVNDEMNWSDGKEGVVIMQLDADSVASKVGFLKGDILRAVNGAEVKNTADAKKELNKPARGWRIAVERGGEILTIMVRN